MATSDATESVVSTTESFGALTPDLKYGVMFRIKFEDNSERPSGWEKYLVEVSDLKTLTYRIVDTLPIESDEHVFGDTANLLYTMYELPGNRTAINRVFLYRFLEEDHYDTLLAPDFSDSSTLWINTFSFTDMSMAESLFVTNRAAGVDLTLAGKRWPWETIVRRLSSDGGALVIKVVEDAARPTFSNDGKQILAERWIEDAPDYYVCRIIVYDIDSDSVTELRLPHRFCRRPRRLTEDGPIYYLGSPLGRDSVSLRCYDPLTGIDSALVHFDRPRTIGRFYLTPDSIVYETQQQVDSWTVKHWWQTVRLK